MNYEEEGFSIPVPNRHTFIATDIKANDRLHVETSVSQFRCDPRRGEEEFTLSAFGFPEPVGIEWKKPTSRYVWFLLASAVFVILAVGFRYLARRWSRSTPATV